MTNKPRLNQDWNKRFDNEFTYSGYDGESVWAQHNPEIVKAFIQDLLSEQRREIANEYPELRDKQGRNLRFYLLPHTEHKEGDNNG